MAPNGAVNKPARSGLSLYANLLDPSSKDPAPGTISSEPVVYNQPPANDGQHETPAADKQQISAAALRFQPTKRPQLPTQKLKAKATSQRYSAPASTPGNYEAGPDPPAATNRALAKTTLADWTADGDDNDANGFLGERRQRGGRKKRKKDKGEAPLPQNWDDIYDPSRPNAYEDYKNSDENVTEIQEWKDRLYAHRMARRRSTESMSDSEVHYRPTVNGKSAHLGDLSFAPPHSFDEATPAPPSLPPEPAPIHGHPTGEDAYARRVRLSRLATQSIYTSQHSLPAPNVIMGPIAQSDAKGPPHQALKAQASISRAPVRYELPPPPDGLPASEAELEDAFEKEVQAIDVQLEGESAPRSLRPGQKGFAERLMSKYGWSKGSGLGASGSGITAPLRVRIEKQKGRSDSEGGGFVGARGMGKIIGGKKEGHGGGEAQQSRFGAMSEVIILEGMVDGMDLDAEIGAGDGGLMQEIGQECAEKYGRVERVFIDRQKFEKSPVFVKFTSQLSALRAVNALEGRTFNGNTITARFFDAEKFESGDFE